MIRLDYYRLLTETQYIGLMEEADSDCHYTPYSVFVLETRLYPLIYKLFEGMYIEITLQSQYNRQKNRMDVYLVINKLKDTTDPFLMNELVEITNEQREIIQQKINQIQTQDINYALIDVNELYKSMNLIYRDQLIDKIPFSYFSTLLRYTGLDSSYNPFIRPEGIYLAFNPKSDYKPAYYQVCKFLISRIIEFYQRGVVSLGNLVDSIKKEKLIKDWDLVPIVPFIPEETIPTLYQANWTDERFAKNRVDFLTRKAEGDPFIRIRITDNLAKRHGIIKSLQENNFSNIVDGSYLKIEVKNLQEARKVSALVTSASALTYGTVLVIAANRMSEIYLYFEYATQKYGNKSIYYLVDNNENPYLFSCIIPDNQKIDFDKLRLEFRDYLLNRLIEVSKISKFKNMSPHQIIEKEYYI